MTYMWNLRKWPSLPAQMVKNLPALQEIQSLSLGYEDPLKGMAVHSSILAWRIPWTEELGRLQFTDRKSTRLNSSHYDPSRMPSSA